ncbi:NAD(P)-binding protein, partial [bacterium endosymbiont of Bathymodiolus sp. 5 South]
MKKITIIGSGFAGLTAVRTLRKQDKTLEITLVSPKAELVYMPSLI